MTSLAYSRAAGPITLGPSLTRITLTGAEAGAPGVVMRGVESGRRVYLVVAGLHAAAPPGVVYGVYVGLPMDAVPGPDNPFLAGNLNFFGATDLAPGRPAGPVTISLDVTATLQMLASKGLLGGPLDVAMVPVGVPATGSQPSLGSLTLVMQ